jgi:hypothetical protein
VEGVMCDVVCTGRFYDFLEKRKGKWGIVLRRLAYEKDRLDPLDPSADLKLDQALLAQFPEGYRHLAYLQTKIGYKVKRICLVLMAQTLMRFTQRVKPGSRDANYSGVGSRTGKCEFDQRWLPDANHQGG